MRLPVEGAHGRVEEAWVVVSGEDVCLDGGGAGIALFVGRLPLPSAGLGLLAAIGFHRLSIDVVTLRNLTRTLGVLVGQVGCVAFSFAAQHLRHRRLTDAELGGDVTLRGAEEHQVPSPFGTRGNHVCWLVPASATTPASTCAWLGHRGVEEIRCAVLPVYACHRVIAACT